MVSNFSVCTVHLKIVLRGCCEEIEKIKNWSWILLGTSFAFLCCCCTYSSRVGKNSEQLKFCACLHDWCNSFLSLPIEYSFFHVQLHFQTGVSKLTREWYRKIKDHAGLKTHFIWLSQSIKYMTVTLLQLRFYHNFAHISAEHKSYPQRLLKQNGRH